MEKIFLVEDDRVIADTVAAHLRGWDYDVRCVKDFQNVLAEFEAFQPQLVLLDISLPFFNGYHWCTEMRRRSSVPIVFLSSASDNMNMVMAMNMGGDDFIAKPFDLHVLTAKVQAMLRRAYGFGSATQLCHNDVTLNLTDATLRYGEYTVELTKNEFRILHTLMERPGHIISRDTLMQRLWETDSFVDENTLTVNVNRLRRKLTDIGLHDFIQTKKGMGYRV